MAEPPVERVLPRAFKAPVRVMSRMLGTPHATQDQPPNPENASENDAIVECGLYLDGVRRPERLHYTDALRIAREYGNGFVWLGLKEPTAGQLGHIAEVFRLHELAVEDAVTRGQRPKVERYADMTFCTMRTARYVEHEELTANSEIVETGDMMMFIGEHFIITVRHGDACNLGRIRAQLDERPELLRQGPWAVAYAVYDLVVDVYLDHVNSIEDDIDVIEEVVFAAEARVGNQRTNRIQRIYQLKRELMEFKRAVLPLQRPLTGLVHREVVELPKEIRRYFRDVHDHLNRASEQVVYFDDLLNSVLQARLAQVTVDQNNDMRKIAAWAGIAAVWTALAGIYGMNFKYIPELDWRFGYPAVWAILLVVTFVMYRGFRRSGWL
jgi:magnesium transporter